MKTSIGIFFVFAAVIFTTYGDNNTNCLNAIQLTNTVPYSEDTSALTSSATVCNASLGNGVWFTFTPTNNGRVNISTCGSAISTSLIIYTNGCAAPGPLLHFDGTAACAAGSNPFGCGSGKGGVSFDGVSNVTYFILAGKYSDPNNGGLLQITATLLQEPGNDSCATPVDLTNNVPYVMSTTNATEFGDPSSVCNNLLSHGVWFKVTPTNTGRVNISTCGSSFNTSLIVYTNCASLGVLTRFDNTPACSAASSPFNCGAHAGVSFYGVNGTPYYILVGTYSDRDVSGTLQITANMPPEPGNDSCANPVDLTNNVPYVMSTTNATEFGDPSSVCNAPFSHGVWFRVTPTNTGRVNISTCGSSFNTSLIAYTNPCASGVLTRFDNTPACSAASSPFNCGAKAGVSFYGVNGTPYYILVGTYTDRDVSGILQITANMPPEPGNDSCANPVDLTNNVPYVMSTTNATEFGDPSSVCNNSLSHGVWFRLTPTNSGPVNLSTCGSTFNTSLIVYTNCESLGVLIRSDNSPACAAASNPFGCGSTAGLTFDGVSGTAYYILAGSYTDPDLSGILQIQANVPPPTNDICTGAVLMTPGTSYTVSTVYATETGDPAPTNCISNFRGGVWYKYQPATTGPVGVTTCGSTFDTVLAVYTGSCGGALTNVNCSHNPGGMCTDRASVVFQGTAGTMYYIVASGNNGASGTLQISIPVVDLVTTGLTATNPAGGLITAGRAFFAQWTVQNQGFNSITGVWTDSLTFSNAATNFVISTFNSVHSAPAAGSYIESYSNIVPQIPAGNYSLIGQADTTGAVAESNKLNNTQVLSITVTNIPPAIALLLPTNRVDRESCVPIRLLLQSRTFQGSYTITNILFFDGSTNNVIGARPNPANSVAGTLSSAVGFGSNVIGAVAIDSFGLVGVSTDNATVFVYYPTNLNVLRADLATNGDFVGCMCALSGSNYVVEAATNLNGLIAWTPYITNQAAASVLAFTNHPALSNRFFRVKLP